MPSNRGIVEFHLSGVIDPTGPRTTRQGMAASKSLSSGERAKTSNDEFTISFIRSQPHFPLNRSGSDGRFNPSPLTDQPSFRSTFHQFSLAVFKWHSAPRAILHGPTANRNRQPDTLAQGPGPQNPIHAIKDQEPIAKDQQRRNQITIGRLSAPGCPAK